MIARDVALVCGIITIWLGAISFFRMTTPFQRIHTIAFLNIAGGGFITLAAVLDDGASPRALKCLFIWLVTLPIGALLAQVTGRALHLRGGERR